jgi:hypothetical protein
MLILSPSGGGHGNGIVGQIVFISRGGVVPLDVTGVVRLLSVRCTKTH